MKQRRINFSDDAWQLVQQEAAEAGVSAGQFVREAAIGYAIWKLAKRGGNEFSEELERIVAQLRSQSLQ